MKSYSHLSVDGDEFETSWTTIARKKRNGEIRKSIFMGVEAQIAFIKDYESRYKHEIIEEIDRENAYYDDVISKAR